MGLAVRRVGGYWCLVAALFFAVSFLHAEENKTRRGWKYFGARLAAITCAGALLYGGANQVWKYQFAAHAQVGNYWVEGKVPKRINEDYGSQQSLIFSGSQEEVTFKIKNSSGKTPYIKIFDYDPTKQDPAKQDPMKPRIAKAVNRMFRDRMTDPERKKNFIINPYFLIPVEKIAIKPVADRPGVLTVKLGAGYYGFEELLGWEHVESGKEVRIQFPSVTQEFEEGGYITVATITFRFNRTTGKIENLSMSGELTIKTPFGVRSDSASLTGLVAERE